MNQQYVEQLKEYLYSIARRSNCVRRKVGAVVVLGDNYIEGHCGAPTGCIVCTSNTCLRIKHNIKSGTHQEICRSLHAEQMAINKAAKEGIKIEGAELYCTTYPCSMCAKSIISSGIRTVYYIEDYPDDLAKELFREAHVTVQKIK